MRVVGQVTLTVKDVEKIGGLIMQGRTVTFQDSGAKGVVVWQRLPLVFALAVSSEAIPSSGANAELDMTANVSVPVSDDMFGRIVDYRCSGVESLSQAPLFGASTEQKEMATICSPLHTGITAVDSLTPIGKGQNMLVVGAEKLGRRDLGLDALAFQANSDVKCVYVNTNGKHDEAAAFLKEFGALENTVVVKADPENMAECVAAAATGVTIAEHQRKQGHHTLVVVDDLECHKQFWDYSERMVMQEFGVDTIAGDTSSLAAANSEMRAFYSSLFQRVGNFNEKSGGGSLSLMLLVDRPMTNEGGETSYKLEDFHESIYGGKTIQRVELMLDRGITITDEVLGKLGIPSPGKNAKEVKLKLQHIDELISLSDGQIILNDKIHEKGNRPAVDSTASVTRIGIGADNLATPSSLAMRQVAARLRFDLAQATDIPPDDISFQAKKQRNRALVWQSVLQQPWGEQREYSEQIIGLFGASEGVFDGYFMDMKPSLSQGSEFIKAATQCVRSSCQAEVSELEEHMEISKKIRDAFRSALAAYVAEHT